MHRRLMTAASAAIVTLTVAPAELSAQCPNMETYCVDNCPVMNADFCESHVRAGCMTAGSDCDWFWNGCPSHRVICYTIEPQ